MSFRFRLFKREKAGSPARKSTMGLAIVLFAAGCFWGCAATPLITCGPKQSAIVADGRMEEWPAEPQFVDEDTRLSLSALSDPQSLSLCVAFGGGDDETGRPPKMGGGDLTVWIDPAGGKEKVFGIHLSGRGPGRGPGGRMPHGKNAAPPADKDAKPGGKPPQMPGEKVVQQVSITYEDTTGPLTMTMEEVRQTGIDIGVGQGPGGTEVYEIDIAFQAGPSLEKLAPGLLIGVGITRDKAGDKGGKPHGSDDGGFQNGPPDGGGGGRRPGGSMGGPPGGGMGGGPMGGGGAGGAPSGKKEDHSCTWFKVALAHTTKG